MTNAQARAHRRADRAAKERQERINLLLAILFLVYVFFAFGIAGACDYADDQRELAYWAERGVTIQRW